MPWPKGRKQSEERKEEQRKLLNEYWQNEKCSAGHRAKMREVGKRPKSKKTRRKLSRIRKGRPSPLGYKHSEEAKKRISEANTGRPVSEKTRQKLSVAKKGRKIGPATEKTKEKISKSKRESPNTPRGSNHSAWNGGSSTTPYPPEFNSRLRLKIRRRDDFICQLCGRIEEEEIEKLGRVLAVNHIDYNKQNCDEDNLIALCCSCNGKANFNRPYWQKFFGTILSTKRCEAV